MFVCKYLYMLSSSNSVLGPLSLALTKATLHSPDLLYIIHGNGYFSWAVTDSSFPIWFVNNQLNTAWNNPVLSVQTGLPSNSVPGRLIPNYPLGKWMNYRCGICLLGNSLLRGVAILGITGAHLDLFFYFLLYCFPYILFPPSSSVSLSYFVLATPVCKCLGKHLCMSSTFSIAKLNGST